LDSKVLLHIKKNISRVIVGKELAVELLLAAVLAEGHVLLEDVPGLGKTLLAKSLAKSIGGEFKRVQFTPDLLPADITGFNIYDQKANRFSFQPGPVMANILLADEINRTIPRTQSSLLECMEECQVTVDGQTHSLPKPFLVVATQNPIELEGTFPLPEAQLDRFLLKISLGYPDRDEEMAIMERFQAVNPLEELEAVIEPARIMDLRQECRQVRVSPPIRAYITELVQATRNHPAILYGASPRGSLGLMKTAQARAFLQGRDYVLPDDVKSMAEPVLAHRLILTGEERLKGESPVRFVTEIVGRVEPPLTDQG
jgi:MoxR-like ATPase